MALPTDPTSVSGAAHEPPQDLRRESPASSPQGTPVSDPVRRTMRVSVVEGGFSQIFINWTSGSVLVGYLLSLGASPTQIALIASVPLLAQAASPLAALVAEAIGRRRLLTATAGALGRIVWLVAALLPQLPVAPAARPALMVLLVLVSAAFQASTGTLWSSWMGDVVPEKRRGSYFGLRAGIVGIVGMLGNFAAGWFLDRVGAPLGFQLVIGASLVSAAAGIALYFLHYDPPVERRRMALGDVLGMPLRDANFRTFMLFAIYWQFSVLVGAPFVIPYFLEELRMSFTQVAVWSAIAAVSALVTTVMWGRVADRVGNKSVLAIGTFVAGTALPGLWILAGLTGHLGWVYLAGAFDAVAWGAIGPALFNLALVSAPREGRVAFIAMYSLGTGIAGFLGGVLSGPLLTIFKGLEFDFAGLTWTGYHTLFLVSGVGRSQAWRLLRHVKEADAWRTRDLLREIRTGWRQIGFPWR